MIIRFHAVIVSGSGRGKRLGIPTYNLDLSAVPSDLSEGVYAGSVEILGKSYIAAIHYGPRPVFKDTKTFEAHLIDGAPDTEPTELDIIVQERLRDVLDFPTPEAMLIQIEGDINRTRAIMGTHEDAA